MTRMHSRLLLLLILLAALALRLWRIDLLPPGFHFDESFEGLEAWRILTDSSYRPLFLEGNFGVAPLNAYANVLTFWLGGLLGVDPGPMLMRVTAAVLGVLGVAALFALASELRRLDSSETGGRLSAAFPFFAAAVLAVMRWHIHFSRMGIEPILVPLEWAAAGWLLLRGWRTGGWASFLALAVVLAATLYTYQGAWIMPPLVGAAALLLLVTTSAPVRGLARRRLAGLGITALAALLLVAPLLLLFASKPELVLLRPSQVNIVGATAGPADQGILHNVVASAGMFWPFGQTGDLDPRRNLPGAPALPIWLALPFWGGLLITLRYLRRTPYWFTLLGIVGLLSVGVISEYAPHFHRILGAAAPAALLCALGLDAIWRWRPAAAPFLRYAAPTLLLVAAVVGARDYFVRWAALPDHYYAFDEGLWEVGRWVAAQPADTPVYLSPRPADHPTLAFAWQTQGRAAPVTFDGRSVFPVQQGATAGVEYYVAIENEDFRTRLLLPEVLPQARVVRTFSDRNGAVYATVYERPAGATAERPPQVMVDAPLGDGISLLGYDVQPQTLRPGEILYLQLHWAVSATPQREWTVFTHLLAADAPDGPMPAGRDSPPGGGSLPTTRWLPGWRVLDEYQIQLPADLPPGDYTLATGLYSGEESLPAGGALRLGSVRLEAAP